MTDAAPPPVPTAPMEEATAPPPTAQEAAPAPTPTPTQQQQPPAQPPALPEDAARNVTVSDPVQHTEGMTNKKYTSYRVEVRPPATTAVGPDGGGAATAQPHSAVLRRYRDFSWLHVALARERPGAVVPPLPEKAAVGNFDPEFVEERRAHLEQFLRRAYVHPELYDARCLDAFLRADDAAFNLVKAAKKGGVGGTAAAVQQQQPQMQPHPQPQLQQVQQGVAAMSVDTTGDAAPPADGAPTNGDANGTPPTTPPSAVAAAASHPPTAAANVPPAATVPSNISPIRAGKFKIKKWISNTQTKLTGKELVHSPDDHLFDEIEAYAEALEKQMRAAAARASSLVKKSKETGADYAELGSVLEALGQAEGDGSGAGECLRTVGEAVSRSLAPLTTDRAEAELIKLEEPLQDHVKYVQAVRAAVGKRRDRRLTYTTALNNLGVKRAALAKFHGAYGADVRRYDAEMSLQRAEMAAESARIEFEECSQRVLREMDRFRAERAEEMRRTMMEYVKVQAEYSTKMGAVWAGLVPKLESIPPGGGGGGTAPRVAYSANGNAGRIPAPPPYQPQQPQHSLQQPPQQQPAVPAVGLPQQQVVLDQANGNGGAMIGGVMYRTNEADVIPGM